MADLSQPEDIPREELWIIVEEGDIFFGNIRDWESDQFPEATVEKIRNWCADMQFCVRFERLPNALEI